MSADDYDRMVELRRKYCSRDILVRNDEGIDATDELGAGDWLCVVEREELIAACRVRGEVLVEGVHQYIVNAFHASLNQILRERGFEREFQVPGAGALGT